MKIGIIGVGRIGATLARQLGAVGHDVTIANSRGPASLVDVAAETGATPIALERVATGVDALVIAIPFVAIPSLTEAIAPLPARLVAIDAGNYVPVARDTIIDAIEDGMSESAWVQAKLGHPIVKAFNTVAAASLADHHDREGNDRIALPVSGDDEHAVAVAVELGEAVGFASFHAADIAGSWRQQPGTPVYTRDLPLSAARSAIANAQPGDSTAWRQAMKERAKG